MSYELLRVEKIEDHQLSSYEKAQIVHIAVLFTRRRTLKEWWNGERPKERVEVVRYFTRTGHTWKDYPSLRDTDIMEWSRLRELYEQFTLKRSLEKAGVNNG